MNTRKSGRREMSMSVKVLIMGLYVAGSLILFYHLAQTEVTPTARAENSNLSGGEQSAAVRPAPGSHLPSLAHPVSPLYPGWIPTPPVQAGAENVPLPGLEEEQPAPRTPSRDDERTGDWAGAARSGSGNGATPGKPPGRIGCRDLPFPSSLHVSLPSPTRWIFPFLH